MATIDQLADADDYQRPLDLAEPTFARLRAQAKLQQRQDHTRSASDPDGEVFQEVYSPADLALLPDPNPDDMFFDFEGDPFFDHGSGLEYLIGVADADGFTPFWAHDVGQEKAMFEAFMDHALERLADNPSAHLYHYASYEPAALKRLASRHGTREADVDDLLRDSRLVDLYSIVRRSIRISQRSYSIKAFEPLYRERRSGGVQNAMSSIEAYNRYQALLSDGGTDAAHAILEEIRDYNRDDCESTRQLYRMLLGIRDEHGVRWSPVEATTDDGRQSRRDEQEELTSSLVGPLLAGASDDRVPALLAATVGYHRRENLPDWWNYFRRLSASADELRADEECAVPLSWHDTPWEAPTGRQSVFRRTLHVICDQEQLHPFHRDSTVRLMYDALPSTERRLTRGSVEAGNDDELTILETSPEPIGGALPLAILPDMPVAYAPKDAAVGALARLFLAAAPEVPAHPAIDILRRRPRLMGGAALPSPEQGKDLVDTVIRAVDQLDCSYLPIQGPPGAGKTFLAGELIRHLVERGASVGVCSTGHKSIENTLLAATGRIPVITDLQAALELAVRGEGSIKPWTGPAVPAAKKGGNAHTEFRLCKDNKQIQAFRATHPRGHVIGGNAWMFSHETLREQPVDYLLIDEAGQFSLADALAVSMAARNLILLGDPQQLPQVVRGTHPSGIEASVLEHILGGDQVIAPGAGYFLDESRRMSPEVCKPISVLSYRGLLRSHADAAHRRIEGIESGFYSLAVASRDCTTANPAESAAAVHVVRDLVGRSWTDNATTRPLVDADIVIVAPFNLMVRALKTQLVKAGFPGVRVGTVDKFQGQEATVVITTLTASASTDLPRGLNFLLSRNRLNVALSRGQVVSMLIYSPELTHSSVTTPTQLHLVSGLVGLLSNSRPWTPSALSIPGVR